MFNYLSKHVKQYVFVAVIKFVFFSHCIVRRYWHTVVKHLVCIGYSKINMQNCSPLGPSKGEVWGKNCPIYLKPHAHFLAFRMDCNH